MTETEASREKFEAWALSELKQDAAKWRHADGSYVYLQSEWLAWQKCRALTVEEAAALCLSPDGRDVGMTGANCAAAIRSLSQPTGGKE